MGLKKYVVISVILLLVIGGYVFSLEPGDYRIDIMGNGLVLPVAVWVMAPFVLLLVGSIFHMLFYGAQVYLKNRAISKDHNQIIAQIQDKLLGKTQAVRNFKTEEFKELSNILSQLDVKLKNNSFTSQSKELNDIAVQIIDINNGKYVTGKELKLDANNELVKKNLLNRVSEDESFSLEVIKKPTNHSDAVVKAAFYEVLKSKSMTTIKKALPNLVLDKDMVMALLVRDAKESDFRISNDELIKYLKNTEFTKDEYILIVNLYKTSMNPDDLIKVFEEVSNTNDNAMNAYIYVLFEYEMIDRVREILTNSSENEYQSFKALLELKDIGKQCTLESISYK